MPPYQRPLSPGKGEPGPQLRGAAAVFSPSASQASLPADKLTSHKTAVDEPPYIPFVSHSHTVGESHPSPV